jgi:ribosomal protein L40E
MMRCNRCGDELPPDARFCIDCGMSLAATGVMTRLGELVCSDCYTTNAEDAWNCSNCGRRLAIDSTPPHLPARVSDKPSMNRVSATDFVWLGDLLLGVAELLIHL